MSSTRRVVVTAGAGGIGLAIAKAFAAHGDRVHICDINEQALAQITAANPAITATVCDVSDRASVEAFVAAAADTLGGIDVLINNAGIMPVTPFHDESQESITRQLEINLRAVIFGSQQAVQRMRPRGRGHIVNLASAAGKGGFPGVVTYCATKFGVVGLCEALHYELHGSGVDVSCVMPAIVRTELTDGVKDHWLIKTTTPEQVAAAIVAALQRPRLDVFVPRSLNALGRSMALVPRRGQAWFLRATGADHLLADAAHSPAREAYELRAAGR